LSGMRWYINCDEICLDGDWWKRRMCTAKWSAESPTGGNNLHLDRGMSYASLDLQKAIGLWVIEPNMNY
jgi:hypothetical protein